MAVSRKKRLEINNVSDLSGPEKAAILIMSVGSKTASDMMSLLNEYDLEKIAIAISRLDNVKAEVVNAVLTEFYNMMDVNYRTVKGGLDYAEELLGQLGDGFDSERIRKKLKSESGSSIFDEFQQNKISQIANFIQNEHPQVAALIFSQLEVDKSAEILGLLSPTLQTEIVYRLASMDKISSEVIEEIEEVIKEHMGGMDTIGDRVKSGTGIVAQILNGAEITVERHVLDQITNRDSQMASDIKEQMFLFEDILHFNDRTVQLIINEMEKTDLVLGLKGVEMDLSEKFLSNMSNRAADMLREDMDVLGPVPLKDVKEAQQRIIKKIKELEEEGQISIRKMGEEEIVE